MRKRFVNKHYAMMLAAAATGLALSGCVDNSYDMSEDIDMTMGLGSEGLQLKLGSTEKIMLADILEVDGNLKTDSENLYYLVEEGNTNVSFNPGNASIAIDNTTLSPVIPVISYQDVSNALGIPLPSVTVPANLTFDTGRTLTAEAYSGFDIDNISSEIVWLKSASIAPASQMVTISLYLEQAGMKFAFDKYSDVSLTLPSYMKVEAIEGGTMDGQTFRLSNKSNLNATNMVMGKLRIKQLALDGEKGKVQNGQIHVRDEKIALTGRFGLKTTDQFVMNSNSQVSLHVVFAIGSGSSTQVQIADVTGRFNPAINPNINNINIADNLPDFLQDDEVTIKVANPTLKFAGDLSQIPASIEMTGVLSAMKDGRQIAQVTLPADGKADVVKNSMNTLYFYQNAQAGPYDPNGVTAGAAKYAVPQLGTLVEKLPDYISVNLSDGKLRLKDEDVTIELNRSYNTRLDYNVCIPFTFNNGLKIVYRDSICDMNDDLQDYAAKGAQVTAEVVNAVPLQLIASGTAIDVNGHEIPGITISEALVQPANAADSYATDAQIAQAAVTTPITLNLNLSDPNLLKKLDRINLRIQAEGIRADNTSGTLSSKQYIQINNIRLKLVGQVTADFN